MTNERAAFAREIATLVSVELLADCNWQQACRHDEGTDRLVFPATDNRPEVSIALPLALVEERIRDHVSNALSSYISWLPPEARPR